MVGVMNRLRNLDAYPKINEDFYRRTLSGGVITLASSIVMLILFFSELRKFIWSPLFWFWIQFDSRKLKGWYFVELELQSFDFSLWVLILIVFLFCFICGFVWFRAVHSPGYWDSASCWYIKRREATD